MIYSLQVVVSDPNIQDAFNQGLYLGVAVLAACLGFSMFRTLRDDGSEEL